MAENNLDIGLTRVEEECSVCLEKINENDKVETLPCNHTFHLECIQEWYKESGIEKIDSGTVSIEWHCPLCRYTMTENADKDNVLYFSIVKFRSNRNYIKCFALLDSACSLTSFVITGNAFYIMWFMCALYGYNGAHNFNIQHLRIYSCFCVIPFIFKILHMYDYLVHHSTIIIYPPNNTFITTTASIISLVLQIYLMHCIYFLSIHLAVFEDRIRQFIDE